MSRFFPQSEYAEDQQYSRTILTTHVLHRGFQTGSIVAIFGSSIRQLYKTRTVSLSSLLRPTGYGAVTGFALMVPALWGRMRGRDEIEWQDRSWRLLNSKSQVATDDFSLLGTAIGVAAMVAAKRPAVPAGSTVVRYIGAAGLGNTAGVVAHLVTSGFR